MPKVALVGQVAEILTERGGKPVVRYVDGESIPSVDVRLLQPLAKEFVGDRYPGANYWPLSVTFAVSNLPDWVQVGANVSIVADVVPNVYTGKDGQKKEYVNFLGRFVAEQQKLKV